MHEPVCLDDFEAIARQTLTPAVFGYYSSGADQERTVHRNREAFNKLLIRPKVMIDVKQIDMSTTILGQRIEMPICISPSAFHAMAHQDGEKATAKACAALQTCFCLSVNSNYSLNDVRLAAETVRPNPLQWFQLYVETDRQLSEKLVRHCEKVGYKALVVTVDRPRLGRRLADLRNGFKLPWHLSLANFDEGHEGENAYFGGEIDPSLVWQDIAWLKSITTLPIVLKGVMRADDAQRAIACGVAGIVVSNHGGRQLDSCAASIEALPEIVDVCKGTGVEVFMDGGIRTGTDVFKALAIGARAVFLGRPVLWGLAYRGEHGVKQMLSILAFDFRLAMALSGCTHIKDITRDYVMPEEAVSFVRTLGYKPSKI